VSPLRIAFVTPAFVTEPNSGGMGSYLHRLTKALVDLGHEPEVFTLSQEKAGPIEFERLRVERVSPARDLPLHLLSRLARLSPALDVRDVAGRVRGALGLSRAFSRRDRERPFAVVQSSDYGLAGLFIGRHPRRRHIVRCSWAADLFIAADGNLDRLDSRLYCRLERYCVRKADLAYAPSSFVARHYRDRHGLELAVVRPPFMLETTIASGPPPELPRRYFMYFGAICRRKGADVLAAALPLVWEREPEFAMVWAGEAWNGTLDSYRPGWGERASQVSWLGLISKPELYAVLRQAEATVLPSRVDNLPNTVIESLLFGVPVIGSLGASIDELIEPGKNGELVPIGEPVALADTLVKAWRGEVPWMAGRISLPGVFAQMEPRVAAGNLLRLAGYGTES
jgi:glycosyltransferase involved in cell wall biosynthesis